MSLLVGPECEIKERWCFFFFFRCFGCGIFKWMYRAAIGE